MPTSQKNSIIFKLTVRVNLKMSNIVLSQNRSSGHTSTESFNTAANCGRAYVEHVLPWRHSQIARLLDILYCNWEQCHSIWSKGCLLWCVSIHIFKVIIYYIIAFILYFLLKKTFAILDLCSRTDNIPGTLIQCGLGGYKHWFSILYTMFHHL